MTADGGEPDVKVRGASIRGMISFFAAIARGSVVAALLTVAAVTAADAQTVPAAAEIKAGLESAGPLSSGGLKLDRATLTAAYGARNYEAIWSARPELAAQLQVALGNADRDGLDPASVGSDELKNALAADGLTPVGRELLLADRFLTFARALAQGRVVPAAIEEDWLLARPDFDPVGALAALASSGDVAATLDTLLPSSPEYDRLRKALVRYQAIAAAGGWQPVETDQKIEPGQKGDIVKALRARLVAEGDLPEAQREGDDYDPPTVAAVKRFQTRNGITVDGRVGASTLEALNVSAAERVEQIRLTLERWRQVPRSFPASRIVVNTAAASLVLYRDGEPALTSRVVVGDVGHPTPVLTARMVAVLFNPPWNVPTSITRKEIQPKLRRDPGYLARNHYVIVGRGGGDPQGGDVDWSQTDLVRRGWRLQQEPGRWNALGGVKFELPNPLDVYLHDTPSRPLFARAMRAASHGCVRVEAARPLASILLGEAWPAEAVNQAIAAGETRRAFLKAPLPVYLLYFTAFVDDDGTIEFREDLYGRDLVLAEALADLAAKRRPSTM
jgi:L,D-transpeptidase YcbB